MKTPTRKMDWAGLKVRSIQELRNGNGTMPLGTEYVVQENRNGLYLTAFKCEHCGAQQNVNRVLPSKVHILDNDLNKEILRFNEECSLKVVSNDRFHNRRMLITPEHRQRPEWRMNE